MEELLESLVRHAREMRKLQKEYFRTRSNGTLTDCKREEKRVGELLKEIDDHKRGQAQQSLF